MKTQDIQVGKYYTYIAKLNDHRVKAVAKQKHEVDFIVEDESSTQNGVEINFNKVECENYICERFDENYDEPETSENVSDNQIHKVKLLTVASLRGLENLVRKGEISYSKMVETINEGCEDFCVMRENQLKEEFDKQFEEQVSLKEKQEKENKNWFDAWSRNNLKIEHLTDALKENKRHLFDICEYFTTLNGKTMSESELEDFLKTFSEKLTNAALKYNSVK